MPGPGSPEIPEKPYLLFLVGTQASAPPDFGRVVADELNVEYLCVDSVRESVLKRRAGMGASRTTINDAEVLEYAAPLLNSKAHVLADLRYNTPRSRRDGPVAMAEKTGARAVALCVQEPKSLIVARFIRWPEKGYMTLPPEQNNLDRVELAHKAMAEVVLPQSNEGIHRIIMLPGGNSSKYLARRIRSMLFRQYRRT